MTKNSILYGRSDIILGRKIDKSRIKWFIYTPLSLKRRFHKKIVIRMNRKGLKYWPKKVNRNKFTWKMSTKGTELSAQSQHFLFKFIANQRGVESAAVNIELFAISSTCIDYLFVKFKRYILFYFILSSQIFVRSKYEMKFSKWLCRRIHPIPKHPSKSQLMDNIWSL